MDYYLLWLLLPVAAASGWYIARQEYQKKTTSAPYELPGEYFKGVNYILNQQPDKAIDLFLKLSKIDKDTAEVHLALGSLFRQRGEVDLGKVLSVQPNEHVQCGFADRVAVPTAVSVDGGAR